MTPSEFQAEMRKKAANVKTDIGRAIVNSCQLVESTAKKGMTDTSIDTSKTYEHNHHPSVEFDYPAIDYGKLVQSVTHDVEENGSEVVGRVGSMQKEGVYTELGTTRMSPRPWLKPSLANNREKIHTLILNAVKGRPVDVGFE